MPLPKIVTLNGDSLGCVGCVGVHVLYDACDAQPTLTNTLMVSILL